MKKSLWTRMISLLLAVVLCVELLPAVVYSPLNS